MKRKEERTQPQMNVPKKKTAFSKFWGYASFMRFTEHPIKCFFASLVFNWGALLLLSFLIVGILTAITGGNLLRGILFFVFMFGGGQIVYPFVALLMKGSDDAYGYSYGFYYGTVGLWVLLQKTNLIENTETSLFISAIITVLVCCIIFLHRRNQT